MNNMHKKPMDVLSDPTTWQGGCYELDLYVPINEAGYKNTIPIKACVDSLRTVSSLQNLWVQVWQTQGITLYPLETLSNSSQLDVTYLCGLLHIGTYIIPVRIILSEIDRVVHLRVLAYQAALDNMLDNNFYNRQSQHIPVLEKAYVKVATELYQNFPFSYAIIGWEVNVYSNSDVDKLIEAGSAHISILKSQEDGLKYYPGSALVV